MNQLQRSVSNTGTDLPLRARAAALGLAVLLLAPATARAARSSHRLEKLTEMAAVVVVGTVVGTEPSPDGQRFVLRVERSLHGNSERELGSLVTVSPAFKGAYSPDIGARLLAFVGEDGRLLAWAAVPYQDEELAALELETETPMDGASVVPRWVSLDMLFGADDFDPSQYALTTPDGVEIVLSLDASDPQPGYHSKDPLPDFELVLSDAQGIVETAIGWVRGGRGPTLTTELKVTERTRNPVGPTECWATFYSETHQRTSRCSLSWPGEAQPIDLTRRVPFGRSVTNGLEWWAGTPVAWVGGAPFVVDVASARGLPLVIPRCDQILALAATTGGRIAFCRTLGERVLYEEHGERGFEAVFEPFWSAAGDKPVAFAAQGEDLAVWTRGLYDAKWTSRVARRRDGVWRSIDLYDKDAPLNGMGTPAHLLLDGDTLWLGFSRGEFGGGLFQVDLITGAWREIGPDTRGLPVTGLLHDGDGAIWVAQGLAHGGGLHGRLLRCDGQECEEILTSRANDPRWGLPDADIAGLAFDDEGEMLLLTSSLGVVGRKRRGWRPLLRWGPTLPVGALLYADGHALISAWDGGLLTGDLETGTVRVWPETAP